MEKEKLKRKIQILVDELNVSQLALLDKTIKEIMPELNKLYVQKSPNPVNPHDSAMSRVDDYNFEHGLD